MRTKNDWSHADPWLIKHYPPSAHNERLCKDVRRLFKVEVTPIQLYYHCSRVLQLKKTPAALRRIRQASAMKCRERRPEDFNERQRQRALSGGWWGGKHKDGPSMSKEALEAMARRNFHNPESRQKAADTRRQTVRRDRIRRKYGMRPITSINLEKMPHKVALIRYQMVHDCAYIAIRGDKFHLYYDENTRRSDKRERTAEDRGVIVRHISMAGQPDPDCPIDPSVIEPAHVSWSEI